MDDRERFLTPAEAREYYNLAPAQDSERASEADKQLAEYGIAAIEMPLSPDDFKHLSQGYAICLEECPELLANTFVTLGERYRAQAGHVRKETAIDAASGIQTADGKNYIHFTEAARPIWQEQFASGPRILRDFLSDGYEIHNCLIQLARTHVADFEVTHPNLGELHFPQNETYTFMRLIHYDAYHANAAAGAIAKPHYDIGGLTIQAFADAPGFWGATGGRGENGAPLGKNHYNSTPGEAQLFAGKGHEKVYGQATRFQPLWHGVDRIIPAGTTLVPERTAVILFVYAPAVDYGVNSADTLPQLKRA